MQANTNVSRKLILLSDLVTRATDKAANMLDEIVNTCEWEKTQGISTVV